MGVARAAADQGDDHSHDAAHEGGAKQHSKGDPDRGPSSGDHRDKQAHALHAEDSQHRGAEAHEDEQQDRHDHQVPGADRLGSVDGDPELALNRADRALDESNHPIDDEKGHHHHCEADQKRSHGLGEQQLVAAHRTAEKDGDRTVGALARYFLRGEPSEDADQQEHHNSAQRKERGQRDRERLQWGDVVVDEVPVVVNAETAAETSGWLRLLDLLQLRDRLLVGSDLLAQCRLPRHRGWRVPAVLADHVVRVQAAGDEQEDPSHHREHDPAAAPGLHQLDPDQVDEGHHGVSAPDGIDGGGAVGGGGGGGGGGGPLSGLPGATPVSSMYTSSRPRCVRTSWSTPMPATTSAWLIVRARSLWELTMIESLMVPGSTVAPSIDLTISIALSASDTSMR